MQIVVHFRKTSVLQFDDAPCGAALRESISAAEQVPAECFYMHVDGKHLADCDILSLSSSMVVRASIKINGGKGGFGAMLKSMAKQAGSKKTTDFGACRDLSGRRLRHVNDELILKKWQVKTRRRCCNCYCVRGIFCEHSINTCTSPHKAVPINPPVHCSPLSHLSFSRTQYVRRPRTAETSSTRQRTRRAVSTCGS